MQTNYAVKQPTANDVAQAVYKLLMQKLKKFEDQSKLATELHDKINRTGRMEAAAEIAEAVRAEMNKMFLG